MAALNICSIAGCENKHLSRGLCIKHYARLRKHGNTHRVGTLKEFIDTYVLSYDGDGCILLFPKRVRGYRDISIGGKALLAHRYVCEQRYGPSKGDNILACHKCGNGNLGCISPTCLYWGTYAQNSADRVVHGTDRRGEKQPKSILKEKDVLEIRSLHGYLKPAEIAEMFGVSREAINSIQFRRTWKWLD